LRSKHTKDDHGFDIVILF